MGAFFLLKMIKENGLIILKKEGSSPFLTEQEDFFELGC